MTHDKQSHSLAFVEKPIEVLDLTLQAYEPLAQARITTLAELISPTMAQVKQVQAFGISKELVREIKTKYARFLDQFRSESPRHVTEPQEGNDEPATLNSVRKPEKWDIDNLPLGELELTPIAHMVFFGRGITTIAQLAKLTDKDFTNIAIESQLDYADIRSTRESLSNYLAQDSLPSDIEVSDRTRALSIDFLGLHKRSHISLIDSGITNIGHLLALTKNELLALKNVNVTAYREIKENLTKFVQQQIEVPEALPTPEPKDTAPSPPSDEVMLAELDLSRRTYKTLLRSFIRTAEQLADLSAEELLAIRQISPASIIEIREALQTYDLPDSQPEAPRIDEETAYREIKENLTKFVQQQIEVPEALPTPEPKDTAPSPPSDEVMLAELDLSRRTYNALLRSFIRTAEQLADLSDEELLAIRQISPTSIIEIREALQTYDLPDSQPEAPRIDEETAYREIKEDLTKFVQQQIEVPAVLPTPEPKDTAPSRPSDEVMLAVLDLSPRTYNALLRAHIKTAKQLADLSDEELQAIHRIGPASIIEIRKALHAYDLPDSQPEVLVTHEETAATEQEGTASVQQEPHHVRTEIISISRALRGWLSSLSAKERKVISSRYGFSGEPQTLQKIGEDMGITKKRIRQIEASAIDQLLLPINYPHVSQLQEEIVQALFDHGGVMTRRELGIYLEEQGVSLGSVNKKAFLNLLAATNNEWSFNTKHGLAVLSFLPATDIPKLHQDFVEILSELQKPVFVDQLISELKQTVRSARVDASRYFLVACARTCPHLEQVNGKLKLKKWPLEQPAEPEESPVFPKTSKPQGVEKPVELEESSVPPPKPEPMLFEQWTDEPVDSLVNQWVSILSEREELIISQRFGMTGKPETLQKIGDDFGMTRERIRQIEAKAIDRLRFSIKKQPISQLRKMITNALTKQGGLLLDDEIENLLVRKELALGKLSLSAVLDLLAAVDNTWSYDRSRGWLLKASRFISDVYSIRGGIERILERRGEPMEIDLLIVELQNEPDPVISTLPRGFIIACARTYPRLDHINGKFALKKWRREQSIESKQPRVPRIKPKPQGEEKPAKLKEPPVSPPKTELQQEKKPVKQRLKLPTTVVTRPAASIDDIDSSNPFYELEIKLREDLEEVDFIGELLIDRQYYNQLCQAIQAKAVQNGRALIDLVPDALFVISMVFTARYSDENARNFWIPYARLVWGFKEAGQYFQNKCRRRFVQASQFFEELYGFNFPRRTDGDVVRPIYRHAIIPFYLQDEFAEWLQKNWQEILELGFTSESSETLVPLLRSDKSVEYLPPTLRAFIQGDETAETAASLIINMATAANLFDEGESVENISDLLAANPIEQALWNELAKVYAEEVDAKSTRRSAWKPQWVWSFEEHEMRLRLRNVTIAAGPAPHQLVWVSPDEDPLQATISEYIDPWEMESGEWWIDEATIVDGPIPGKLVLLTESNVAVGSAAVNPLPKQEVAIFRGTQQGIYGIPIDLTNRSLVSGDWFISLTKGASILDQAGNELSPKELLPVPTPLNRIAKHHLAGRYRLHLPVTIQFQDQSTRVLERQTVSAGQPQLVSHGKQFSNLSPRVPPAFADFDIWLMLPEVTDRLIKRTTLWLKSSQQTIQKSLRELVEEQLIEFDSEGQAKVNVGAILPHDPGSYALQLRQSLKPLMPSPLQFSVLPGIQIRPPDHSQVYSPSNLPSCFITGIQEIDIVASERHSTSTKDNGVLVIWHDLRDDCRLQLHLNKLFIPLAWNVKRLFAWLDPEPEQGFLTTEDLGKQPIM